jgi:DNA uptake protein ComE-like DNA-binding protein
MKRGSILVALLWCVAILSIVVIGVMHSVRMDVMIAKNSADQTQAFYLALAGVEKAKALLYHDAGERKRAARNHSGALYDSATDFKDVPLGRGTFSVVRQGRREEGGKIIYGISDEESRLNVTHAPAEELAKLVNMTPEIVAAILDWRDGDNVATPGGAEAEYYMSLPRPLVPRNAPFQSTRELLMVRGITRELFMGEDTNQNGLLDPEEDDGDASSPRDNHDGVLDSGWSGDLTVDSWVSIKNAAGTDRVNAQSADEKELTTVRGMTPEIVRAIVAYRGQKQIENLADLLDVAPVAAQRQQSITSPNQPRTQSQPQATGPKLISEDTLIEMADELTTGSGGELPGAININSASVDVLACLPGITPEIAQAIVRHRSSAGFFPNVAAVLKVDGMTRDIFRQISPKVSARSETFRIMCEGRVPSSGARKRIQAIVRLGDGTVDTISWREDL